MNKQLYLGVHCKVDIPDRWLKIVKECLECIQGICEDEIQFTAILSIDGELVNHQDLHDWSGIQNYVEDEICFANADIQKLEGGDTTMLYDEKRCANCSILTSSYTAMTVGNKVYCKTCGVKIAPPKLVIVKKSDGKYVIDGKEQTTSIDVKAIIEQCDWFMRRHKRYNDGHERMELEYFGKKICRYFEHDKNVATPASWGYCLRRGICSFL